MAYGSVLMDNFRRLGLAWLLCCFFVSSVYAAPASDLWAYWQPFGTQTELPSDTEFTQFLQRYRGINPQGVAVLDYQSVSPEDRNALSAFVGRYTAIDPRQFTRDTQFVYWVNLYNAQIILQILAADIPSSIRDIKPGISGLLAGGPWRQTQVVIAGKALSFNDIEHRILRPIWRDARVHFVLNCASIGCPDLPAKPLTISTKESVLEQAVKAFVNHPRGVRIENERVILSSIFDWFAVDFGDSRMELVTFINKYRQPNPRVGDFQGPSEENTQDFPQGGFQTLPQTQLALDKLKFSYQYDWSLNAP